MKLLLVEDNFIIAMHVQRLLERQGHQVIGPCATARDALDLLANESIDGALLDYRLADGETSLAVAEDLESRGCAFAFVTGLDGSTGIPDRFSKVPQLTKPIRNEDLLAAVAAFRKS